MSVIPLIIQVIKWLLIVLFTPVRKVLGLFLFWPAMLFRGYARNVVFNYKLNNGLWLKRLYERPMSRQQNKIFNSQITIHPYHETAGGFISTRYVSPFEYFFVYWFIWGWLDDDSNYDVMDLGYVQAILRGEHKKPITMKLFRRALERDVAYMKRCLYGNAFDLGDKRNLSKHSAFRLVSTALWVMRNTAYNFKYDQYETCDETKTWLLVVNLFGSSYEIGWAKDGEVKVNPTCAPLGKEQNDVVQNYTLVFRSR